MPENNPRDGAGPVPSLLSVMKQPRRSTTRSGPACAAACSTPAVHALDGRNDACRRSSPAGVVLYQGLICGQGRADDGSGRSSADFCRPAASVLIDAPNSTDDPRMVSHGRLRKWHARGRACRLVLGTALRIEVLDRRSCW